jgi:hypothetical protein
LKGKIEKKIKITKESKTKIKIKRIRIKIKKIKNQDHGFKDKIENKLTFDKITKNQN